MSCWAAEIILGLKKQKARCRDILKECTDSVTVCENYSVNAYQRCNYYMVDRSQYGIAVYDNDRSIRSSAGLTVQYAMRPNDTRKKGVHMRFIHPDNGKVTE